MGFPNKFIEQFKTNFRNLKVPLNDYQDCGDMHENATLDNLAIPIISGVQQGSSKSGMLFVFLLAPLLIQLKNDQLISPLKITTSYLNNTKTTYLNNIMGYSDDLTVDCIADISDDGTC